MRQLSSRTGFQQQIGLTIVCWFHPKRRRFRAKLRGPGGTGAEPCKACPPGRWLIIDAFPRPGQFVNSDRAWASTASDEVTVDPLTIAHEPFLSSCDRPNCQECFSVFKTWPHEPATLDCDQPNPGEDHAAP